MLEMMLQILIKFDPPPPFWQWFSFALLHQREWIMNGVLSFYVEEWTNPIMFPFDGKVNLVSKVVKIQVYFPSKIILVLFSLTVLDKFDMIKIKLLYKDQINIENLGKQHLGTIFWTFSKFYINLK